MRNTVFADLAAAGNGLTVVDPDASLIEDLLDPVPRHRTNGVINVKPAEPSRTNGPKRGVR